jgi:hypothetical protein
MRAFNCLSTELFSLVVGRRYALDRIGSESYRPEAGVGDGVGVRPGVCEMSSEPGRETAHNHCMSRGPRVGEMQWLTGTFSARTSSRHNRGATRSLR